MTELARPVVEGSWRGLPAGVLAVGPRDLDLAATLDCGQAFRWRLMADGWWHGVIGRQAVRIRRAGEVCEFQVVPSGGAGDEALLREYLRLDVDLPALADDLAGRCARIRPALQAYSGLRILAQHPDETLLSFLCSPANSVARISRSIEHLCRRHGAPIAILEGVEYRAFPSASTLASLAASEYRAAGLGWRGVGIRAAAEWLLLHPPQWLVWQRGVDSAEARGLLVEIPFVGPKIADCVLLFGLQKDEAVPVDTHVWAIARELFPEETAAGRLPRSLTARAYQKVAGLFRARYGPYAGWAQQYLYQWRRHGSPG